MPEGARPPGWSGRNGIDQGDRARPARGATLRLIAPVLVVIGLALLVLVPEILIHVRQGSDEQPVRARIDQLVLDQGESAPDRCLWLW